MSICSMKQRALLSACLGHRGQTGIRPALGAGAGWHEVISAMWFNEVALRYGKIIPP